ncbi:hypothetical protein WR25_12038 [Diploscapter pachys]|uniref:Uncharacterized protein n=1 Tax=Diploscapter pachys TaxID=2018661 RepID=A0A2A2LMG6_9BILA|nr:hypothetical protein WR25_12038 [Diploscapter pachys]
MVREVAIMGEKKSQELENPKLVEQVEGENYSEPMTVGCVISPSTFPAGGVSPTRAANFSAIDRLLNEAAVSSSVPDSFLAVEFPEVGDAADGRLAKV